MLHPISFYECNILCKLGHTPITDTSYHYCCLEQLQPTTCSINNGEIINDDVSNSAPAEHGTDNSTGLNSWSKISSRATYIFEELTLGPRILLHGVQSVQTIMTDQQILFYWYTIFHLLFFPIHIKHCQPIKQYLGNTHKANISREI